MPSCCIGTAVDRCTKAPNIKTTQLCADLKQLMIQIMFYFPFFCGKRISIDICNGLEPRLNTSKIVYILCALQIHRALSLGSVAAGRESARKGDSKRPLASCHQILASKIASRVWTRQTSGPRVGGRFFWLGVGWDPKLGYPGQGTPRVCSVWNPPSFGPTLVLIKRTAVLSLGLLVMHHMD